MDLNLVLQKYEKLCNRHCENAIRHKLDKILIYFPESIIKGGRGKMREKMTNLLSLPKEIALNLPLILATGRNEVNIENYKNLIEFTDTKIRINTAAGAFAIEGAGLNLKQITTEHILITGKIEKMNWGT